MNTFIMMWNPEISNWKMNEFEVALCHFDDAEFNWAIYDYKKAKVGDRFFMVCCGGENQGIVMSGTLSSKPYKGEDWSGKGREVFYVNMDLGTMIHPNYEEILSVEELEASIPDFDWRGGHSGRLLDKMSAGKLEFIWQAYLNENEFAFDKGFARRDEWYDDSDDIINDYLRKKYGETCECCGFNYKKSFGRNCKETIDYISIDSPDDDYNVEDLEKSYHALCPNCQRIIKTCEDLSTYKK